MPYLVIAFPDPKFPFSDKLDSTKILVSTGTATFCLRLLIIPELFRGFRILYLDQR